MKSEYRYQKINDFFDSEYKWWEEVYDHRLPRGFFSFEMIRRKEILLTLLGDMAQAEQPLSILECGCGPGGILGEIKAKGNLLAGVDINFNSLAKAKKDCHAKNNLLQGDIERLPFKDNSFDIAYCVGVLSYLEGDRSAMQEIARVIKPGGKVILSVPNFFTLNKFFDPYYYIIGPILTIWRKSKNYFLKSINSDKNYKTGMIRRYRFGELDRLYKEFGLIKQQNVSVSFGPPTFWRREILPLCHAMQVSEALVRFSSYRNFSFLKRLANHWVTSLEKACMTSEEIK